MNPFFKCFAPCSPRAMIEKKRWSRWLRGSSVVWGWNRTPTGWKGEAQVLTLALTSTCWVILSPSLNLTKSYFLSRKAFLHRKSYAEAQYMKQRWKQGSRTGAGGWGLAPLTHHTISRAPWVPKSPRGSPSHTLDWSSLKGLPSLELDLWAPVPSTALRQWAVSFWSPVCLTVK